MGTRISGDTDESTEQHKQSMIAEKYTLEPVI